MGTGHVMRCLALARALRDKGARCIFLHRLHPGHMAERIEGDGFSVVALPAPPEGGWTMGADDQEQWLGVPQEEDAAQTWQALSGAGTEWLVVDHYGLDQRWEKAVESQAGRLAVIDDLANRRHMCDLVVDQNYVRQGKDRYDRLLPPACQRLIGPRYALLRAEYAMARQSSVRRGRTPGRILVFYGGVDRSNETARALRVLSRAPFRHLSADVVIGANNPYRHEILESARRRPGTEVHSALDHLATLMAQADICLGAGGTSTWERCAVGLPTVVTSIADNQEVPARSLGETEAIEYLGPQATVTDDRLAAALESILRDPEHLLRMADAARMVTDGLGALRVAEVLVPSSERELSLRPAQPEDKALYYEWANDPETRAHAFEKAPIPWHAHDQWFDRRMQDDAARLFVMCAAGGLPVGQVRVDLKEGEAVISFSIDRDFRGRGWGRTALTLLAEWWGRTAGEEPLVGYVLGDNVASQRAFQGAGYVPADSGRADDVLRFQLPASETVGQRADG